MRALWILALSICFAATALAETTTKPQRFDFDDDLVESDLARPEDALVNGAKHPRWGLLIQVRTTFIPELLRSVDDR